jgi:hypothetical protein
MPLSAPSPVTPDTTPSTSPAQERKDLLVKMSKCLNDAGGIESNIGVTDLYWTYLARYRFLLNQG